MKSKSLLLIHWVLFLSVALILYNCKAQMKSPLMGFKLGEPKESWQKKLNNLLSKEELKKIDIEEDVFLFYFQKGDEKLHSHVYFNIDGLEQGGLRSITFHLTCSEKDSISTTFGKRKFTNKNTYFLTRGLNWSRKKHDIDNLVSWIIELYGFPSDTINAPLNLRYYNPIENRLVDNLMLGEYNSKIIWKKDMFDIELLTAEPTDDYSEDDDYYSFAVLSFKINSHDEEITKLSQQNLSNVKSKDVVKARILDVAFPDNEIKINGKIFDNHIQVEIGRFERFYHKELPNDISKVKLDIIFQDEYQDELFKITDVNLEFDYSLESHLSKFKYYKQGWPSREILLSVGYNYNNTDIEKIRKVDQLRRRNELYSMAEVKAIIFENGEVFK